MPDAHIWRDDPEPRIWRGQYRVDAAARLPNWRSFVPWYATGLGLTPEAANADLHHAKALKDRWVRERNA